MDVQLTQTTTIRYAPEMIAPVEASEEAQPKQEWWRNLPTLFWATLVLFSVNLIIAGSLLLTERLRVDAYGQELTEGEILNDWRPSPFTEVVDTARRKVRKPEQIYPAAFIAPEPSYSTGVAGSDSYSYMHTYVDSAAPGAAERWVTAQAPSSADLAIVSAQSASALVHRAEYRSTAGAKGIDAELKLDIPRVTAAVARVPRRFHLGSFEISPHKSVSGRSETATN